MSPQWHVRRTLALSTGLHVSGRIVEAGSLYWCRICRNKSSRVPTNTACHSEADNHQAERFYMGFQTADSKWGRYTKDTERATQNISCVIESLESFRSASNGNYQSSKGEQLQTKTLKTGQSLLCYLVSWPYWCIWPWRNNICLRSAPQECRMSLTDYSLTVYSKLLTHRRRQVC